jgi:nitrogen-specific signal transduction histidine kinase
MGLTVVWNIVHQHGGTVEARSQPGQGARSSCNPRVER